MTNRKRKTSELQLAIDFGGSMTKAIGGTSLTNRWVLAMEPDVIQIPPELVTATASDGLKFAQPSDSAWIGWGDEIYGVGYYARTYSIANPQLSQLKRNLAVYKVGTAIWVMQQKFKLTSSIKLDLVSLLPVGEYEDRERLEEQLKNKLKKFQTPTGILSVQLRRFECRPEGAGVMMSHAQRKGLEDLKKLNTALIMVGYRNTSFMVFERGNRSLSQSSDLGFARLVKNVVAKTSGYNLEKLTPVIAQYLEKSEAKWLHSVLLDPDTEYELNKLTTAINTARQQFQWELSNWLKANLPNSLDEIVLSGGTADVLKSFFLEEFKGKRVYLHANVEFPRDIYALGLGSRLADVWLLWQFFQEQLAPSSSPQKTA